MIWGGEVASLPDDPDPADAPELPEPDPVPPPFGAVPPPDPVERRRPIVSRASFVVARPTRFVNTARYSLPVSDALAVNVYVTRWAPRMLAHVRPRLTERCHCVLGAGLPDAAAVKPARRPAAIVTLRGWTTTAGRRRPPRERTMGVGPGRKRIIGAALVGLVCAAVR